MIKEIIQILSGITTEERISLILEVINSFNSAFDNKLYEEIDEEITKYDKTLSNLDILIIEILIKHINLFLLGKDISINYEHLDKGVEILNIYLSILKISTLKISDFISHLDIDFSLSHQEALIEIISKLSGVDENDISNLLIIHSDNLFKSLIEYFNEDDGIIIEENIYEKLKVKIEEFNKLKIKSYLIFPMIINESLSIEIKDSILLNEEKVINSLTSYIIGLDSLEKIYEISANEIFTYIYFINVENNDKIKILEKLVKSLPIEDFFKYKTLNIINGLYYEYIL